MTWTRWSRPLLPLLLGAVWISGALLQGGEVTLKNGMTLPGTPVRIETLVTGPKRPNPLPTTVYPIVMVSNPLQKYFVPARQVESESKDLDLTKNEIFRIRPVKQAGGSRVIAAVGEFLEKPAPFDEFGRRTVKLGARPVNLSVFQQMTEITPVYVKITALNYGWDTALATSSISIDVLDPILRKASGGKSADHRLKIARFYIQAEMYEPAQRELTAIGQEFPELAERVEQARTVLNQAFAQELVNELKLRRNAGQHRFVYEKSRVFPTENVDATVLREVRELSAEYETALEEIMRAQSLLAELQAQLGDDRRVAELAPRRAEISESLNLSNLQRLDAFRKLSSDPKLKADEKLALALSGWVVGSPNAVTELDQALRYWQARSLLLDYLRLPIEEESERKSILQRLNALEGWGATRTAQALPLLPPPLDLAGAEPGKAVRIEVPEAGKSDDDPAAYWVLLPPEYHPEHHYPAIVALHGQKRPAQQELAFWGGTDGRIGQSQRHGYIVLVPEYTTKAGQSQYDYSPASHRIVIDSLRDARRRFSIDSDRVFLAGHDMGGDAAFDISFSHPDLFAGVIPIAGVSDRYCEFYWQNVRQMPLYVISGELDRDTVAKNTKELMRMLQQGFNLVYTEFVGAGADPFYSEIHKLFDWMSRHRRSPLPKQIEVKTLRETDNHFYWYEFEGIPKTVTTINWTNEKQRNVRPMNVTAVVNEANTIVIQSGAEKHRIWLTPEGGLIDFDKRLGVRIMGKQRFNDFIKPDIEAMLEWLRYSGDQQRLFWARLDF